MTQSMTVNGVLRVKGSRRKQRPGRLTEEQRLAQARRPRARRRKKSNAELIEEVAK